MTNSHAGTTVQKNVYSDGKEMIGLSRLDGTYEYTFILPSIHSFMHTVINYEVCITTGPKPLPK